MVGGSDVALLGREHAPGEDIEAEYVRGGEVLHGRVSMSVHAWPAQVVVRPNRRGETVQMPLISRAVWLSQAAP